MKMIKTISQAVAFTAIITAPALHAMDKSPTPEGAAVYILSPESGATVSSPVTVVFGAKSVGVSPAGIDKDGTGHHHLITDAPLPDLDGPSPQTTSTSTSVAVKPRRK